MSYLTKTDGLRALGKGDAFDNCRTWDNQGKELPPVPKKTRGVAAATKELD
jgi:hypothetical protein